MLQKKFYKKIEEIFKRWNLMCLFETSDRGENGMDERSELIFEKMVDHFGLWDEPAIKKKFSFDKKEEPQIALKPKKKYVTKIYTDALKARREEILSSIKEIQSIEKKHNRVSKKELDKQSKQRRLEINYIKQVIEAELHPRGFILAS
jgi:hypothetical protein